MNYIYQENRISIVDENEEMLAEILFPIIRENVVEITRTYVSPVLRGQGIAGKLMQEAVKVIEKNGWKAVPSCSYAETWIQKNNDNTKYTNLFIL